MSDPSKHPLSNRDGGRKFPAANPSSAYGPTAAQPAVPSVPSMPPPAARAKPPVIAPPAGPQAGGAPGPLPGQIPAGQPFQPGPGGYGHLPPRPAPPVPTPRNAKGIALIIALVVALPLCLLLACGVGGYFIYSQAKSSVETAAKSRSRSVKVDPDNPFAELNSPDVQKKMEQEFDQAFDKLDAERKRQQRSQPRNRTRPGRNVTPSGLSNSGSDSGSSAETLPDIPAEPERDDLSTNLKRLQTGTDQEKQRAANWFSRAPLEADKQEEVAKALNAMDMDGLRKHALGALKVWGTAENVPMIAKIMQQEAFVKIDCMKLLEKFKDERAIEPLITVLNEAFDEGQRAEELLADWWPQAEQPLIKHMHDKEGRLRERTQRILELRKTDQALLVAQTLQDMESSDREVRKSAVAWLTKAELKTDLQPQVAVVAQKLISDSNGETRRSAVEMFGKYAQKEQADELLKLVDENDYERWKAGLTGLIRLGDVRVAEKIGRRKEVRHEAFRMFREAGAPAQDIVAKTLTHIEVKDWITGKDLCEILGDIGTSKSVGFLMQVKKKATAAKTPFVGEAAEKAIEDIRRRNAG
jgi:HEAT repeat protein